MIYKFRDWNEKDKFMYSWETMIGAKQAWIWKWIDAQKSEEENILMQFTGLLDKNGVEIYAGDIVDMLILDGEESSLASRCKIVLKNACWGFEPIFPQECHVDDREFEPFWKDEDKEMWPQEYFTKIGNIYENPELLKGE